MPGSRTTIWSGSISLRPAVLRRYFVVRPAKAAGSGGIGTSWGLSGVDFTAGINQPTYEYYIDFASRNGLRYLVLDDGWSRDHHSPLETAPGLDLPALVKYGEERGVGLILWLGYLPFAGQMEELCKLYSEMGIKGFKVDFMDRDDQQMVRFVYDAARTAARYRLLLDLHGIFKPAGIQRTYPNVINFEGVHGLEQVKWSPVEVDQVTYDVTVPFIPDDGRTDGLYAGSYAQCLESEFPAGEFRADESGNPLPAAGRVCRIRCSARDAVRLPVGLRTGTRMPALHLRRAYRLG